MANIKFYKNPSGGSRVAPCGQLEMQKADMTKTVVDLRFVANDPAAFCGLQYKCKIWCFGVLKIHILFWSSEFTLEMASYVSPKRQLTHYLLLQPRTRQPGFGLPRQVFPVQSLIFCVPNWTCSLINVYVLIKVYHNVFITLECQIRFDSIRLDSTALDSVSVSIALRRIM